MKAYRQLGESDDVQIGNDSWQSEDHRNLMKEIADALDVPEKDRL